jgi:phenylacetate-coenzyme A ligase PaaK-like adenylate-forming protein
LFSASVAQLRFAISVAFGVRFSPRSLARVLEAIQVSEREFGPLTPEAAETVMPPLYEPRELRRMQLTRIRRLAASAVHETVHYEQVFAKAGVSPRRLSWEDFARLPLTTKRQLRAAPEAFVARSSSPVLAVETTGTSGRPTRVYFSSYDLAVLRVLGAIGFSLGGLITREDILVLATAPRAVANLSIGPAAECVGATVQMTGMPDPLSLLAALSADWGLPGKRGRPTLLAAYPSYLGALCEAGLEAGYRHRDFGLKRIFTGSELVTDGLKQRLQNLFGEVAVSETYALTETLPFGGQACSAGHLHFDGTRGVLELLHAVTGEPAVEGEPARIVATPLPPYRDSTLLLRYDTEDVVDVLAVRPECELRHLPATSAIRGKLSACVVLDGGELVCPREVAEALEASAGVPLPARYTLRGVGERVAVEVVVRDPDDAAVRRKIAGRLIDGGVPLSGVRLVGDPGALRTRPLLRSDLREPVFASARVHNGEHRGRN